MPEFNGESNNNQGHDTEPFIAMLPSGLSEREIDLAYAEIDWQLQQIAHPPVA